MVAARIERIGETRVSFVNDRTHVTIYCIRPAIGAPPVYVGSTSQRLRLRIRAHLRDARTGSQNPIHGWMRECREFVVEVLETIPAAMRHERERFWVGSFVGLLNVTDGGPGMSGHRFAGTEHARRIATRISTSQRFMCETCSAAFHRKHSQAAKGNCRFCSRACFQQSLRGRPSASRRRAA